MNECIMGCDPPAGGDGEKFYVVVMQELTIYGHTTDAYTKARFPEDWPRTEEMRARGVEFGCWHSSWCAEGELGSQIFEVCREISYDEFIEARDSNWPEQLDSPLTAEIVMTWDSLHGSLGAGA